MQMTRLKLFYALGASLMAAGSVWAAPADPPVPTALATLQPGQWALRSRDGSAPPKSFCLGDPRVLLQIRHGAVPCSKFTITNNPAQAVVHYSCAGAGNGRTEIRVETPRVIQIESQGIEGKEPFDWAYEGRRVGECPVSGPTAQR
jgi:hypothetical protein